MNTEELKTELSNYYGTTEWFKHSLSVMTYTEGVQAFAEGAGAYWLLDIFATEVFPLLKTEDFLNIEVMVKKSKATILVDDGNDSILFKKAISFTDCPEGTWQFFLTDNVLMLPSEY